MSSELIRIATLSTDKCKPSKCSLECKKNCPVVKMGRLCIEVFLNENKVKISEELCIGCGICVKKCPYQAISVINFPKEINQKVIHKFGLNSFRLFRLPIPKPGQILGIIGTNGIGKSTSLKILSGKLMPNLGNFENPPEWQFVIKKFRGNELQKYFDLLCKKKISVSIKPQYIESFAENLKGRVEEIIFEQNFDKNKRKIHEHFFLDSILKKEISTLSGGELQRCIIAYTMVQQTNVFLLDELTSYLDIKQRIKIAKIIRNIKNEDSNKYIVVVEHDLAIIDYLSDFICCLYGKAGTYGVVTLPYTVSEGINIYLSGYIPTENLRFRDNPFYFNLGKNNFNIKFYSEVLFKYPKMRKTLDSFQLSIEEGEIKRSEIIVLMGENGTGKTLFVKLIGNILKSDENFEIFSSVKISYKPQKISPIFKGLVQDLLFNKLGNFYLEKNFQEKIIRPLGIDFLFEKDVQSLSGGELQRLAITLCIGKTSDIYLIDEPSAYLDIEQRVNVAKTIKNFIIEEKKASFIVEHDFMMSIFLADKIVVFDGEISVACVASSPKNLSEGLNIFLKNLEITFRKDPINFRPRINQLNSVKDKEQKSKGTYFFYE
jgi:ATP-binding cassette subfamily E protein 1